MTSMCLENLEALAMKGVDMEVVRNNAGVVYLGGSCFTVNCHPPNRHLQGCQTLCASSSLLRIDGSYPLLDKHGTQ